MMTRNALSGILLALMLLGVPTGGRAAPCSLAGLGWMAGTWRDAKDPTRIEERWVVAPQGVLMGNAWGFPAKGGGFAEAMTITEADGAISMRLRHFDGRLDRAWEEQEAPMVFVASQCGAHEAVFSGGRARSRSLSLRQTALSS